MSLESKYKKDLIDRIRMRFPGCMIFKLDTSWQQGAPDMLILWGTHWAVLEVKRDREADKRPNQEWFVAELDELSFSAIIYPENEEQILNDMERSFEAA